MRTIWIPALTLAVFALGACSDDSGSPDGAAPAPEAGPDLALDSGGPSPDLTPDTGVDMAADGPAAAEAGGGDSSSPEAGLPDAAPDASGPTKLPTTAWAEAPAGAGATLARGVAADSAGNAYVTGTYMGTVSFGATKLVSSAPADTFVCKVSPAGKFLWAVSSAGGKGSWGAGVAADGTGHVYVTGGYGGVMTLGATKLTASGTGSTFVAKLDAATGKFLWAVTSSGVASHDDGHLIRVDGKGEPYLAGHYIGAKQFGTVKLASGGGNYHYVARLDAKGTFKWVVPVPGRADNDGLGFGINAKGESCIAGAYRFSVTVGGKTFTSLGQDDITVVGLDAAGKITFAATAGSTSTDRGWGAAREAGGGCVITGKVGSAPKFGSLSPTISGYSGGYVARLDKAGAYKWVTALNGTKSATGYDIALDAKGNATLTGSFEGQPSVGAATLSSLGGRDVPLLRLGPAGKLVWAVSGGGATVTVIGCVATLVPPAPVTVSVAVKFPALA